MPSGWRTTIQTFLKKFYPNTCNETAIKANFHFSHYKAIEILCCHSNQSTYATTKNSNSFVEAHGMNISAKFGFIPHIASEEMIFYGPQLRRSSGGILVWASACMCLSVRYTLHLICGISMKNKRTSIFYFSVGLFVAEFLCHYKPMESCQQYIWRTTWARIMIFGSQFVSMV